MSESNQVVTIVGGGASAHVLIPFLSGAGYTVQMLTRRPSDWHEDIELQLQSIDEELEKTWKGRISKASSEPADVIPQSDFVVLCMPVHTYRPSLHALGPHLRRDKEVFVGTIYGQAGFNWMVDEMTAKFELENITTFAVGLIPWICRIVEYGRVGVTYGCKEVNVAAVSPRDRFDALSPFLDAICARWLKKGPFEQSETFLAFTLSVDNQIIHPTRCFGLFKRYGGQWANKEDIPYFYRDYDDLSADLLRELDADYTLVRDGIRQRFPERDFRHMLDYLALERLTYATENVDIRESFATSQTLGAIKPPMRQNASGAWEIDTDHRFFTDDITYGVCIAKWMAEQMGLDVPTMDAIIEWVQQVRDETFIVDGKLQLESESLTGPFRSGIPPVYGIHSLEGVVD